MAQSVVFFSNLEIVAVITIVCGRSGHFFNPEIIKFRAIFNKMQ